MRPFLTLRESLIVDGNSILLGLMLSVVMLYVQ